MLKQLLWLAIYCVRVQFVPFGSCIHVPIVVRFQPCFRMFIFFKCMHQNTLFIFEIILQGESMSVIQHIQVGVITNKQLSCRSKWHNHSVPHSMMKFYNKNEVLIITVSILTQVFFPHFPSWVTM